MSAGVRERWGTTMFGLKRLLGGSSDKAPTLAASRSRMSERGEALAAAISKAATLPPESERLASEIEAIRRELKGSHEQLGAWERPWLAHSPELQARLNLEASDDRYETSISVAKAADASKSPASCRALMALVLHAKPQSVIEMGTNLGVSGLYIAAALKVNGAGRLVTLEGAPSKAKIAAGLFERLGLPGEVVVGDFAQTLAPAIERTRPVDLAFIDGFHEGTATVDYHRAFKADAAPGAILAYDDINWSDGMKRAWFEIVADRDVEFALDYDGFGVAGLR